MLRSFIHFQLLLVQGERQGSNISLVYADYQIFPATWLKRLSFLQLIFVKDQLAIAVWFMSRSSILIHWSSCLFLCQILAVFIVMALQYSLESGIVIVPALDFC
jgi:hypothetical protein